MANAKFLGTRMWEYWPQVKITNKTGFSALPVGYATDSGKSPKFTGINNYAVFWTSDSESEETGLCRYIYVKQMMCLSVRGTRNLSGPPSGASRTNCFRKLYGKA